MKKPVIIFDFDKTLTPEDTVFGFYKIVSGKSNIFTFKRLFFLLMAILTKVKIINNNNLKKWGVRLFLKGHFRKELIEKGKEYAANIKMNSIFKNDFNKYPAENVLVISASFEEYLIHLFPDHNVVGSKILYDKESLAIGLKRNLYGINKLHWLRNNGIDSIDLLYTDSFTDKPLMEISKRVYLVNNEEKKLIKGEDLNMYEEIVKNNDD